MWLTCRRGQRLFRTAAQVRSDYGGAGVGRALLDSCSTRASHFLIWPTWAVNRCRWWCRIEQENLTYFLTPFDIRGTAFIIWRYLEDADKGDPYRADDAWAYIPNPRRVRRISAEVKSDSLLGTDITIDDFRRLQRPGAQLGLEILGLEGRAGGQ